MPGLRAHLEEMFPAHFQAKLHMTDAVVDAVRPLAPVSHLDISTVLRGLSAAVPLSLASMVAAPQCIGMQRLS